VRRPPKILHLSWQEGTRLANPNDDAIRLRIERRMPR